LQLALYNQNSVANTDAAIGKFLLVRFVRPKFTLIFGFVIGHLSLLIGHWQEFKA
jgi:hypothetical protein